MTYDRKTKLVLLTWELGSIFTETVMLYMDPYTSELQKETILLNTPFGWSVRSVQALFDDSTRHVLFLIKQTNLQGTEIIVWSITVQFDTMNIIEKKQIDTVMDVEDWTFLKTENNKIK